MSVVPEKTCIKYITEVSTVGQILLQCCRKDTFVFTRNVNNHRINQEAVSQIVRFNFQFYLKIIKDFEDVFTVQSYAV